MRYFLVMYKLCTPTVFPAACFTQEEIRTGMDDICNVPIWEVYGVQP